MIVVGCPRSGTTMLQLMLHAHPRIAVPPETRFVLAAYRQRRDFGPLEQPERRRGLARWIVERKQTRFADLGLAAEETVERIEAAPPTLGSALGTVFQAYSARFDKPRWGDKRPAYLQNLDVILRLFPDAQIINIVRDGRDCVASLKEMPWHRQDIYTTIAAWARAADEGHRAAARLDATQYHQLRYEDLVKDPETQLRALCSFLDEEYHPAMAHPNEIADVAVPAHKTWHARTRTDVDTQRVRSWQQRLTADEIALCEAALGDRLTALGYEPADVPAPRPAEMLRYRRAAARNRLAPVWRRLRQSTDRLVPQPPVAARLTSRQLAATVGAQHSPNPVAH
ncbi:MAG TPA: sulfotransferase [Actinoplanes sp.]|nr:sulfotransferase [Actinoplanes sp.]